MTIGESLKRFRKEFKLTRNAVAETLGIKPQSYVYEVKDVTPSAQVILDLADHYNVSADYLLGRTDKPRPNESPKIEVQATTVENESADDIQSLKADNQSLRERLARLEEKVDKLAI